MKKNRPCDCENRPIYKNPEIKNIRKMAETESQLEKRDYIIYKDNNTYYYEARSCWEKAGGKGIVIEYVNYTECSDTKR